MRKIVTAGSILVDKINEIAAYPKAGELAQIRARSRVPGGLVPNTGCDIRILDPSIPVAAFGAVGDDDDGRFAVAELNRRRLDTSGVVVKPTATSFTDVMSVPGGERTFFTFPGASAEWGYDDFPFGLVSSGDIVLMGYFLLLEKVDGGDGLRILRELKSRGASTAIDLVTGNADRSALVRECLPCVDNLVVNEIEAARLAGIEGDLKEVAARLLMLGVQERVVIHMPEKGVSLLKDGTWTEVEAVAIPEGFIKGKTGAGDAFCAGCLVGIFNGLAEKEILELGALAAVGALSAPGATEGMRTIAELRQLVRQFKVEN
ncbi:MAG: carbohydrate kinase family protein [Kiritimatiellae bacterium]|nr:carbohydrate kinase family protein [Kiritimatiellia bacterium]